MIKLPEPISEIVEETDEREGFVYKTAHFSWDSASTRTKLFTESQLKQYGDDRAREALEEAAKVANATVCDMHIPTGVKIYGQRAGKAIHALLKETK